MAKTLSHYEGTATGSGHFYWYKKADDTSEATRVYNGDLVKLPTWYASEINNGMYRVTYPGNGWMFYWNVTNIKPAYETTTDKCTAPTSVTIDTKTKVLTITGGAGGDLNTLKGFGVSYRERAIDSNSWGSWSSDEVISGRTMNVSVAKGKVRQYRARTRGSAGSSYFSAYVTCATVLTGNSASGAPVIAAPVQGATTWSNEPLFVLHCPEDPDGDELDVQASVDGGEWESVSSSDGSEGAQSFVYISGLSEGEHTVRFKLVDTSGNESPEASVTITRKAFEWNREIERGTIIANDAISHVRDIEEMLERLNVTRTYFGLEPITLPGTLGLFADWKKQMEAIRDAENEYMVAFDMYPFEMSAPEYPNADYINMLRSNMHEVV